MSTINRLSSVDVLQPSDQIPVWDSSNGDTRKASMSTLLAFVESYFADPDYSTRIVAPNVDGFNVDIGNTGDSSWLIVNPTLNYTTGSITLPTTAYAVNDQEITVVFTAQVSSFSITGAGATVLGAPTQIGTYDSFRVRYNAAQLTWYTLDTTGDGSGAGTSSILRQDFTGDGVVTTFTLANTPAALGNELQVFINGVYQERSVYTISGADLIFSAAPPNTSTIEVLAWGVNDIGATTANLVTYTPAGTGAVADTVANKLGESVSVADFGAVGDGATNDAAAIQAAITYVATTGTTRGIVNFEPKTYLVTTTIIVPLGITLNLNLARLDGGTPSSGIAYNSGGFHMFESGYYTGSTPTSNRGTALNAFRVTDMVIQNGLILNCNSAMYLTNCNEGCLIADVNYQGVSRATSMVACFYMNMGRSLARQCADSAPGQILHHILGNDNNLIAFESVTGGGAATTFQIDGTANFCLAFNNCSFEEGKVSLSSTGIRVGAGAYVSGLSIENGYFEGVRYGLEVNSTGGVYGGSIRNSIFNNNEYAVLCSGVSGLRLFSIENCALPDGGGTDRNLIDVSPVGNDVIIQTPAISNLGGVITNVVHGNSSRDISTASYEVGTDLNARSNPSGGAKNNLVQLPYQGRAAVTVGNNIPYSTLSRDGDDNIITTSLVHDVSNVLTFDFSGNSSNITWDVKGFIFGTTVSYVTQSPAGITVAIETVGGGGSAVAGGQVFIRIAKDAAGFGAVVNTTGMVRHV
jgi:hypothetical protein